MSYIYYIREYVYLCVIVLYEADDRLAVSMCVCVCIMSGWMLRVLTRLVHYRWAHSSADLPDVVCMHSLTYTHISVGVAGITRTDFTTLQNNSNYSARKTNSPAGWNILQCLVLHSSVIYITCFLSLTSKRKVRDKKLGRFSILSFQFEVLCVWFFFFFNFYKLVQPFSFRI